MIINMASGGGSGGDDNASYNFVNVHIDEQLRSIAVPILSTTPFTITNATCGTTSSSTKRDSEDTIYCLSCNPAYYKHIFLYNAKYSYSTTYYDERTVYRYTANVSETLKKRLTQKISYPHLSSGYRIRLVMTLNPGIGMCYDNYGTNANNASGGPVSATYNNQFYSDFTNKLIAIIDENGFSQVYFYSNVFGENTVVGYTSEYSYISSLWIESVSVFFEKYENGQWVDNMPANVSDATFTIENLASSSRYSVTLKMECTFSTNINAVTKSAGIVSGRGSTSVAGATTFPTGCLIKYSLTYKTSSSSSSTTKSVYGTIENYQSGETYTVYIPD